MTAGWVSVLEVTARAVAITSGLFEGRGHSEILPDCPRGKPEANQRQTRGKPEANPEANPDLAIEIAKSTPGGRI